MTCSPVPIRGLVGLAGFEPATSCTQKLATVAQFQRVAELEMRPDGPVGPGLEYGSAADLECGRRRDGLPFRYTLYQAQHTHASWLIDRGIDLARTCSGMPSAGMLPRVPARGARGWPMP